MADNSGYTAESIQILEGLEAVRKRPAMYIGDTGKRGFHHLVYEVLDNSIDEHLAGYGKNISVTIYNDGSVSVMDEGRGVPVEKHASGKSALEVVMTILHAGGKFEKKAYKVSGGLHGVGVSVVNALSEEMSVEVHRDGKIWIQKYAKGIPQSAVKPIGNTDRTGTTVRFKPDPKIFQVTEFEYSYLRERIMELAFLNAGLKITIKDERTGQQEEFHYEGGIKQFVEYLNKSRGRLHPPFYIQKTTDSVEIQLGMQYTDGYSENIYSFVNDIKTIEGGTHVTGFKSALTRVMNDYLKGHKSLKEEKHISGDDVLEGLTAIISIKIPEPQFEGQTKTKLGNAEVKGIVDSLAYDSLKTYMEENPYDSKVIVQKIMSSMEAREAAQKAKDLIRRKSVFESSILPGKLADCEEKDPAKSEIFLVEGDSAGGCFSGDTKIALADGRNVSFRELVEEHRLGKMNFCYTIKADGRIGIAPIKEPRITKKNAEVVKVVMDNGEEVVCTPDHLFMLHDGSYKKAEDLAGSLSLMPLYRQYSRLGKRITIEGYEMVFDPKESRWIFTHLLGDGYNLKKGKYSKNENSCVHHIDFKKRNNNPTNLRRMDKQEHLDLHASIVRETMTRPEVLERIRAAHQSEEYRQRIKAVMRKPKMRKMLSERAKKQWDDEAYKRYMTERFLSFYSSTPEYRKMNNEMLNQAQREYWSDPKNRRVQSDRVRAYFREHPEKRAELAGKAKTEWEDDVLLAWRSQKTREQWTPQFRMKRKASYNETYKEKALSLMKAIFEKEGELKVTRYDEERLKRNDRTLLRYSTICQRFFDNNEELLMEQVRHYNHKIKGIQRLNEKIEVYDFEVEETHNFALASGVFVHNSSKQSRDRRHQAILPLKGKILNVEKAPLHKVLTSEEIRAIVLSVGAGFGDDFDLAKCRYHKIIIASDADVDGSHIRTLILTLFYRHFKPLIEKGYLYIATPPLYRIKTGKTIRYAYSDQELQEVLKQIGEKSDIQRYKGLGEMNPEQLWETTMDPERRTLKRVNIEDGMEADALFSVLMGEEVEPRKEFIVQYAKQVKNLDI